MLSPAVFAVGPCNGRLKRKPSVQDHDASMLAPLAAGAAVAAGPAFAVLLPVLVVNEASGAAPQGVNHSVLRSTRKSRPTTKIRPGCSPLRVSRLS